MKVLDEYEKSVKWLTDHPECIHTAWNSAVTGIYRDGSDLTKEQHQEAYDRASCLFKNCGRIGTHVIGCLTQVAHGYSEFHGTRYCAETPELTDAIREDADSIPVDGYAIKVRHLPVFAEWRRRVDTELGKARTSIPKE